MSHLVGFSILELVEGRHSSHFRPGLEYGPERDRVLPECVQDSKETGIEGVDKPPQEKFFYLIRKCRYK